MITMITIIPNQTPSEIRLALIDEQLKYVENYAKGAAHALNKAMDIFWETDDDLLIEMMNQKGPVEMNNIFTAHAENATNINLLLSQRGIEPIALIGMRKPVVLNSDGLFEINYPTVEEVIIDESV